MDGTIFFPIGLGLVLLAVILSAIGIRGRDKFPPSAPVMVGVCALFFAVVASTAALGVVNASEEKEHRDEEIAHEQAEAEEAAAAEEAVAPPAKGKAPPGETASTVPPKGGQEQGGATELALTSPEDGSLVYEPDSLQTTAGAVTITYANPSAVEHNVALEGDGAGVLGQTETFAQGEQQLTIEELPEGEYTYFCTVPGHREGGMEGTLVAE
jgi:plastocyanin